MQYYQKYSPKEIQDILQFAQNFLDDTDIWLLCSGNKQEIKECKNLLRKLTDDYKNHFLWVFVLSVSTGAGETEETFKIYARTEEEAREKIQSELIGYGDHIQNCFGPFLPME